MTDKTFLQDPEEFNQWLDLLIMEKVTSYLEIGSKFGEALKYVGHALPSGSRLVGVDLPHATKHWGRSGPALSNVAALLNRSGQEVNIVLGDSTDPKIVERVAELGPYDAVFIDANHTLEYVEKDWANYGSMAKKLVAFHDISWEARGRPTRIDVPRFWEDIKPGHRWMEIKTDPTGCNNGIGVIWKEWPT